MINLTLVFKIHQVLSFFRYWLNAVDQHALHGPFMYSLYTQVILPAGSVNDFEDLSRLRSELRRDKTLIGLNDLGSGSTVSKKNMRPVADIARHSLTPRKYSLLYYRLIRHFQLRYIIELGTSLGLNTLYLARNPQCQVATFEGCNETLDFAQQIFGRHAPVNNIELVNGNIDNTLPDYLKKGKQVDFVLFDANHSDEPTLQYYQHCKSRAHHKSIFVFDDIHWSPTMEKAWLHVVRDPDITLSVDLFRIGIVFFDPKLSKQHFVLRF